MAELADLSEEQFRAFVAGTQVDAQPATPMAPAAPPPTNPAAQLTPQTSAALNGSNQLVKRNAPPLEVTATSIQPTFVERNARTAFPQLGGGQRVPLDVRAGLPMLDYLAVARQRGPDAQLQALQQLYPNSNARQLDNGDLAVEVMDSETGTSKDVVLNPAGVGAADLVDLAVQVPEMAAGAAMAIATQGKGFMRTLGQIVLSALASGWTGAGRDVMMREFAGQPTRMGEILRDRSGQTALDMFFGTLLAGGAKAARAFSPFARELKPGSLEFDQQRARAFFDREFGEKLRVTPAEATGSTALQAVEAAESLQPGSRTVMGRFKQQVSDAFSRIQQRALGQLTSEERIGEDAIGTLRSDIVEPLEQALEATRQQAAAKGQQRVLDLLDEATGIGGAGARVTESRAGALATEDFNIRLAQAEKQVDLAYDRVKKLPGGSGDVLSGTPAADAASAIRKELPHIKTAEGNEVLDSGVPEGLLHALDDLERLRGAKVSLQTLTNMKKAAYDAIAAFKTAHGDAKDRWFTKIASAYEQGIDEGVANAGSPELHEALTAAKDTYKRVLLPFERPGLKELAKGEFDAANLSPQQVFDRMLDGPKALKNYQMLKEVLGADSPVFATLKRAWADTQIARVTDPVTKAIDPAKLEAVIDKLAVNSPELAKELLGDNAEALSHTLRTQRVFNKLDSLDESEVKTLLRIDNPSSADLHAVLRMQANRDAAYVNTELANLAAGRPLTVQPTEFVNRLRNTSTPTPQVKQLLDALPADTREAVATAELYRLLDKASVRNAATASKAVRGEPLDLSPTALSEALGRPGTPQRERIELLLGDKPIAPPNVATGEAAPTRLQVLEQTVAFLAPRETRLQQFSGAGGIGATMQVNKLMNAPLKYAKVFARNLLWATLYTTEAANKLAANRLFGPEETAALANYLIASEPVIRRFNEVAGSETARAGIASLKDSIDQYVRELAGTPPTETEKLLQGQPAKVQVRAQ